MRLAAIESLLPPRTMGPRLPHPRNARRRLLHQDRHGALPLPRAARISTPKPAIWVTIPIRLPHRFSNPFEEEIIFVNTITLGFFVRYFEYLEELIGEGKELAPEVNRAALMRFATVPLGHEQVEQLEEESRGGLREAKSEESTDGGANGFAKKGGDVFELDLAANGGKGVSGYGIVV